MTYQVSRGKKKKENVGVRGEVGLDCSSVIEHLPSMHKALDSFPRKTQMSYRMLSIVFGNMSMLKF